MKSIGFSIFLLACSYPPEQPSGPINFVTAPHPSPVISPQAESQMRKDALSKCENCSVPPPPPQSPPGEMMFDSLICSTDDSKCTSGVGGTLCFEALSIDIKTGTFEYRTSGNIQVVMFHSYKTGDIHDNTWFRLSHDKITGSMTGDVINEESYAPEVLTVRIHDGRFEVQENSELNGSCVRSTCHH